MTPTISVIIPAYNAQSTIGQCLEGVLQQSYNVSEIIVVDDGSTDNTIEIVEKYECQLIRSRSNIGVAGARNIGLKHATSQYIYFVDSDCVPFHNCIEEIMSVFSTYENIGIVGGTCITSDDRNLITLAYDVIERHKDVSGQKIIYLPYLSGSNLCMKKEVVDKVGFFNEKLLSHEDFDYTFRANDRGYKIMFNPGAATYHHNHRRSIHSFLHHVFRGGVYGTIFRLKNKPKPPLSRFYPNNPLLFLVIAPLFIVFSIVRIIKNNIGIRPIKDIIVTLPFILIGQVVWGIGCSVGVWKYKTGGDIYS